MDLIQLTPRLDVDPSQPVRSPGQVLLHTYLIPNAINAARLARRSGIPDRHIKALIAGIRPITAKDAIRLAAALDTTAFYWLALQARYDLERDQRTHRIFWSPTE